MGLVSSPSVRSMRTSNGVGAKIGRMRSEEEEATVSFEEQKGSDEEEAGRRIEAATEGDTGDLIRSLSETGMS